MGPVPARVWHPQVLREALALKFIVYTCVACLLFEPGQVAFIQALVKSAACCAAINLSSESSKHEPKLPKRSDKTTKRFSFQRCALMHYLLKNISFKSWNPKCIWAFAKEVYAILMAVSAALRRDVQERFWFGIITNSLLTSGSLLFTFRHNCCSGLLISCYPEGHSCSGAFSVVSASVGFYHVLKDGLIFVFNEFYRHCSSSKSWNKHSYHFAIWGIKGGWYWGVFFK